jgi:hypothetical protein
MIYVIYLSQVIDKIATPFWVWLKIPSPWCTMYEGKEPSSVIVGLTERSMNYDSVLHWIKAHFFSYFPWHPSSTMEEKNQSKYLCSVKLSAAGFNKIRSMFCFTSQGPYSGKAHSLGLNLTQRTFINIYYNLEPLWWCVFLRVIWLTLNIETWFPCNESESFTNLVLKWMNQQRLFLVPAGCVSFGLSLAFPFCLPCDGSSHRSFIGFCYLSFSSF